MSLCVSPTTVAQGDHFGAESFILGTPHTCDLVAANSCECLLLYRRPFIELLRRFPQLSAKLMKTAEVCSRRWARWRHIGRWRTHSLHLRLSLRTTD